MRTRGNETAALLLLLAWAVLLPAGVFAENPFLRKRKGPCVVWAVTVVKARGLRDLDPLPGRGTSDPFVKIIRRESIYRDGPFRVLFLPVGQTPVVENDADPVWNYTARIKRTRKGSLILVFRVLDKDPHGSFPLGVARLVTDKGGVFRLRLKRNLVGSRNVPGVLTVRVEKILPMVRVPDLIGLSLRDAENRLAENGLHPALKPVYKPILYHRGMNYTVNRQYPAPGSRIPSHSMVRLVYTRPFTMTMPNLKGLTRKEAEKKFPAIFRKGVRFGEEKAGSSDRSRWFRVTAQSVPPGTTIGATTPVMVLLLVPAPGTLVEVPDVKGKRFYRARWILSKEYLRNVKIRKVEHPTLRDVVLSQDPPAGRKIPFDSPRGVTLSVAVLADGRSLLTAKSLEPGPPFTCFFSRKKHHEFRKIRVPRPGYLVARSLKITRGADVEIRFFSPDFKVTGVPPVARVAPGTWYVDFASGYRGPSRRPARLQVEFVPEFDPGEPNDTRETARLLEFPTRITFGICGPKDRDHYRFELKKSSYLEIRGGKAMESDECHVGIRVTLTDGEGEKFYSGPLDCLRWLPPGTYDLEFWGEEDGFDTRPYTVDLRLQEDLDRTEPNDTISEATLVRVPAYVATRFENRGSDYFHLVSKEPGFVIVSTGGTPLPSAVICNVTDSRDRRILPHGQLPRAIRIDKDAFVNLGLECGKDDERRAPVVVHFAFIPLKADPLEPNDSPGGARTVPADTPLKALLLPAEDRDFYKFTLDREQEVTFEILQRPKEHFSCVGHIFDSRGKEITKGQFFPPFKKKLPAGTYILEWKMEGGMGFLQTEPYVFRITTATGRKPAEKKTSGGKARDRYRVPGGPGTGKDAEDAVALAARAYMLLQKGRPAQALALYVRAAGKIPRSPALWNDMGVCSYKLGKFPVAEKLFKKALALKGDYTLALRNLGVLANRLGDPAGAASWCAKAVRTEPSAVNLSFLGHFQLLAAAKAGNTEKKKELLRQALKNLRRSYDLKKDPKVGGQIRIIEKALGS